MELAKKLKQEGHHVEIDRKRSWYDNDEDRDRKLSNVFNSVGTCTCLLIYYLNTLY